jgi:hypothetical protein
MYCISGEVCRTRSTLAIQYTTNEMKTLGYMHQLDSVGHRGSRPQAGASQQEPMPFLISEDARTLEPSRAHQLLPITHVNSELRFSDKLH